jgi:hypothetical protein
MATIASDDFNRADSSSLGSNWTQHASYTINWWTIASNVIVPNASGGDAVSFWNADSFPDDQWSQADVTVAGTTAEVGVGPACRVQSGANNLYWAVSQQSATYVAKFVGGTYTLISSITHAWTNGHTLRFEAEGSTLRVFDNGTQYDAGISDGSIGSGSAGVAYSSLSSTRQLDNWAGGNIAATQQLDPDADIATSGWTTAPLFSKINDASDATVITGAAS